MNILDAAKKLKLKLINQRLPHLLIFRYNSKHLTPDKIVEIFNSEFVGHHLPKHPDLLHLKIDDDESIYKVNSKNFENFYQFINYRPVNLEHKFVYIEDAHLISEILFNKLLKTLEELKNSTTIFLLIPDQGQILATVKSRSIEVMLEGDADPKTDLKTIIIETEFHKNLKDLKKNKYSEIELVNHAIIENLAKDLNFEELDLILQRIKQFHNSSIFNNAQNARIASILP